MSTARNCVRYSKTGFVHQRSPSPRCAYVARATAPLPERTQQRARRPETRAVASWLDHTRGVAAGQSAAQTLESPWDAGVAAIQANTNLLSLGLDVQSKAVKVQRECGMFASESAEEVAERLRAVLALLPGLGPRISFHSAKELGALMQDPNELSNSLLRLSDLFPNQDVSELVIADTTFADPAFIDKLPQEIARVKMLLKVDDIADLFKRRPLLLDSAKVQEALDELVTKLPAQLDAARLLRENAYLIYPMNRAMLPQHLME